MAHNRVTTEPIVYSYSWFTGRNYYSADMFFNNQVFVHTLYIAFNRVF